MLLVQQTAEHFGLGSGTDVSTGSFVTRLLCLCRRLPSWFALGAVMVDGVICNRCLLCLCRRLPSWFALGAVVALVVATVVSAVLLMKTCIL